MNLSIPLIGVGDIPTASFVIALDGPKDLRAVPALREEILSALKAHTSVAIDTRKTASLDTGVVQLLLAASRSAKRSGQELSVIAEVDGALPQVMARLGLATAFA